MNMEQRAERAVSRIPLAAVAIVLTLAVQFATIVWWAGTLSERMATHSTAINRVERKVDDLTIAVPTPLDRQGLRDQLRDHEARIRELESSRTPRL